MIENKHLLCLKDNLVTSVIHFLIIEINKVLYYLSYLFLSFRWEKYDPVGQVIENTRIFAFKTPLKLDLQNRVYKDQRFSTFDLFRKVFYFN